MSEAVTGTPNLNKALAAVQAELPKISKDQEGKVSGEKNGRTYSYSYKYADLADLSEAVLPLLGKNGLAFTALPGLNAEGKFGIAYALVHASGEEKAGFFPITYGTAQQNGSAITYARRYCLGAVTGVAPAEDDDGAAASHAPASAGDAWDAARPAAAARSGQRQESPPAREPQAMKARPPLDDGDPWKAKVEELTDAEGARDAEAELEGLWKGGQVDDDRANQILYAIRQRFPKDQQAAAAAETPAAAPIEDASKGTLGQWAAKIDAVTTAMQADDLTAEVDKAHRGGVLDSRTAGGLRRAIKEKAAALAGGQQQGGKAAQQAKPGNDEAWIRDWKARLAKTSEDHLGAMRHELAIAVQREKITSETSAVLNGEINSRRRELQSTGAQS